MRGFLFLVLLLGALGAGGYFTKPTEGLHRGVASVLMQQGKVARPDAAGMRSVISTWPRCRG